MTAWAGQNRAPPASTPTSSGALNTGFGETAMATRATFRRSRVSSNSLDPWRRLVRRPAIRCMVGASYATAVTEVRYPTTEVGGLCLASPAIQHPKDAALASMTGTSWESEDSTGPSDQWPVLVQHAGPGTLVGRERVTRWRTLQRNAAYVQMGTCGWANRLSAANGSAQAHQSSTNERAALTTALKGGASAPRKVKPRRRG